MYIKTKNLTLGKFSTIEEFSDRINADGIDYQLSIIGDYELIADEDYVAPFNVEDAKAKIKENIAALEDSVTPRRQREAILSIDTTWLADIELQIGQLRQQLAELQNAI
jgi:hypothetical protein